MAIGVLVGGVLGAYASLPDLALEQLAVSEAVVDSGQPVALGVVVTCSLPEQLSEDPRVEVSLRRLDKPESCAASLETVSIDRLHDGEEAIALQIGTSGLSGGEYEIVVQVDPEDRILEDDETNNRRTAFLTIRSLQPELHPVGLISDPSSPISWGETATLRATVENTGGLAAGAFHAEFLLFPFLCRRVDAITGETSTWAITRASIEQGFWQYTPTDVEQAASLMTRPLNAASFSIPDSDWARISSVMIAGLERNEQTEIQAVLGIPEPLLADLREAAAAQGIEGPLDECELVFLVKVLVATPDGAPELDPSNNAAESVLSVIPTGLGKPDLVPVQVTFDEDLPLNWDDGMVATAVIANRGGSRVEDVEVYFDYRPLGTNAWIPLRQRTTLMGQLEEVPERIDALGIEAGSNSDAVHADIDPLSSMTPMEPGSYELRVWVDKKTAISERNENNNQLIVGFSVRGSELQPISLDLPANRIRQGDTITVATWVRNLGDRPVSEFTVGFYINDVRFDTFFYRGSEGDTLDEDEEARTEGVLNTVDLPQDTYILRVVVDPDDRIPEFDEANNTLTMPIVIEAPTERRAELHVTTILIHPTSPVPRGAYLRVTPTIRNSGTIRADTFPVEFVVSPEGAQPLIQGVNTFTQTVIVGSLARSASVALPSVEFPTSMLPNGPYRLLVRVDPADAILPTGEILELDELNNTMVIHFSIGEATAVEMPQTDLPNLTCRELAVLPAFAVEAGTVITLAGSVVNSGGAQAAATAVLLRWADPFGSVVDLGTQPLRSLGPGQLAEYSFSVDTSGLMAGPHQVRVVLDPQNTIPEANEGDNECHATAQIGAIVDGFLPDLVPVSVRFDSPDLPLGVGNSVEQDQRLYAYVTVRNDGNIPSGAFAVEFETPFGVATEQWVGVGPLDQVEVSHPLPTATAGEFALSIQVDPDNLIPEEDETNNGVPNEYVTERPVYSVIGLAQPKPALVVAPSGPAVRWMTVDESTGLIYAVWVDGQIRSIDSGGAVVDLASLAETVSAVAWSFGSTPYAYVGTATGTFRRVDLETGGAAGEAVLGRPIVAVAPGGSGRVFVALEEGFQELALSGSEYTASSLVDVPGSVRGVLYDRDRTMIYILSTAGVHAFDSDLSLRCVLDADRMVGTPSAFALGGSGLYVSTDAGTGGILHALSHCTSTGGSDGHMLLGWRYPRIGALPGTITSVVIDPRDIDPIYVATSAGTLYSLGFDGSPQWANETGGAIHSLPRADKRTGRIFFGDDAGIPHVLTLGGVDALEIDLAGYTAGPIRSTLVLVETREKTDFGTRLVRNYYYGTENGAVYKIASQQ